MQQLKKSTIGNELRELADRLRQIAQESPAMSIAMPIVVNACDHLTALARNIDHNQK